MFKPKVNEYSHYCLHCGSVSGSHKDTETLIRWRMAHGYLFSGWRNTCRNGWEYVFIVIHFASAVHVVCILIFYAYLLLLMFYNKEQLLIKGFANCWCHWPPFMVTFILIYKDAYFIFNIPLILCNINNKNRDIFFL